jgi:hypothetical protein
MTPKNRNELADLIENMPMKQERITRPQLGKRMAEQLLEGLDAAGLAIVPKEPTEAMLEAGEGCAAIAYAYDLMLEASPFKEDTDHE